MDSEIDRQLMLSSRWLIAGQDQPKAMKRHVIGARKSETPMGLAVGGVTFMTAFGSLGAMSWVYTPIIFGAALLFGVVGFTINARIWTKAHDKVMSRYYTMSWHSPEGKALANAINLQDKRARPDLFWQVRQLIDGYAHDEKVQRITGFLDQPAIQSDEETFSELNKRLATIAAEYAVMIQEAWDGLLKDESQAAAMLAQGEQQATDESAVAAGRTMSEAVQQFLDQQTVDQARTWLNENS